MDKPRRFDGVFHFRGQQVAAEGAVIFSNLWKKASIKPFRWAYIRPKKVDMCLHWLKPSYDLIRTVKRTSFLLKKRENPTHQGFRPSEASASPAP